MNNLLNVTNAADRAAVIQTNFERLDDAAMNFKQVNVGDVSVTNADGEKSLLEAVLSIPAGALLAGDRIRIEVIGNITDDDTTPNAIFRFKIGGSLFIQLDPVSIHDADSWRLNVLATIREAGAAGQVAASMNFDGVAEGLDPLIGKLGEDVADTTTDLTIDVTAEIDGGSTSVNVKQLVARVER